jgi:hypothetical protein
MWHILWRGGVYTIFRCRNPRERGDFEDPGLDERIIIRRSCKKWDIGAWPGSIWLRIGTGGGHL